jgi:hypothetical protein
MSEIRRLDEAWNFETGHTEVDDVSVSRDGSLVAALAVSQPRNPAKTRYRDKECAVVVLNRRGKLLWKKERGLSELEQLVSSLHVADDGSFVFADCLDGQFCVFDPAGELLWGGVQEDGDPSVTLATDRLHFLLDHDSGHVEKCAPNGKVLGPGQLSKRDQLLTKFTDGRELEFKWTGEAEMKLPKDDRKRMDRQVYVTLRRGYHSSDEEIVVAPKDGRMEYRSPRGQVLWSRPFVTGRLFKDELHTVTVTEDERVVLAGTMNGELTSLDTMGSGRWKAHLMGDIRFLSASQDGSLVVVGNSFRGLAVFDGSGEPKRRAEVRIENSMRTSADARLAVVASEEGVIRGFESIGP